MLVSENAQVVGAALLGCVALLIGCAVILGICFGGAVWVRSKWFSGGIEPPPEPPPPEFRPRGRKK